MPLIIPSSGAKTTAAYSIANSCRFDIGDTSYLTFTQGTPTDANKWTVSCWVKKSGTFSDQDFISGFDDSSNHTAMKLEGDDTMNYNDYQAGDKGKLQTNRKFRDPSSWYHYVFVWDSDNGTAGDRMRFYVNGVEETSFSTDSNPSSGQASVLNENTKLFEIGRSSLANYFSGYLAEIVFSDGQAYAASDFGEFDSDSPTIWKPKDVSGLTFGDNGFWLDFEDSSALGNDVSGNDNDFTATNLAAVDQSQDSPTNNFCTLNPLDGTITSSGGLAQGNTTYNKTSTGTGHNTSSLGTMGVSSGKWYWELKITDSSDVMAGFLNAAHGAYDSNNTLFASANTTSWGWRANGDRYISATGTGSHFNTYTTNDILSFAIDLDNDKCYAAKNGTWEDSGDPTSGATGTGSFADLPGGIFIVPAISNHSYGAATLVHMNFGNGCFGGTAVTATADQDENGYGLFEYAPPSGYLALCTKNLGSDGG